MVTLHTQLRLRASAFSSLAGTRKGRVELVVLFTAWPALSVVSGCEHYGMPFTRSDAAAIACDPDTQDDPEAEAGTDRNDASLAQLDGGADGAVPKSDAGALDAAQGSAPARDAATASARDAGVAVAADSGVRGSPDAAATAEAAVPSNVGPLNEPLACAACEKQKIPSDSACANPRDACLKATGTASKGPKASAPKATLCADLVKCVWRSDCAYSPDTDSNDDAQCLCGKGKGMDCISMSAVPTAGDCKNEIFAAAETTDLGEIANRFTDPSYAVGLAFQLIDCDAIFCAGECGLSKHVDAGL